MDQRRLIATSESKRRQSKKKLALPFLRVGIRPAPNALFSIDVVLQPSEGQARPFGRWLFDTSNFPAPSAALINFFLIHLI